jgi:ankyrin repeat protein
VCYLINYYKVYGYLELSGELICQTMNPFSIIAAAVKKATENSKINATCRHDDRRIHELNLVLNTQKNSINDCKQGCNSHLQTAVCYADLAVVETLLDHGANPNSFVTGEQGPLDCLSEVFFLYEHPNRYKIAAALLDKFADASTIKTRMHLPLLQVCCFYGDIQFLQLLYDKGKFSNTVDSYIRPVVYAVRNTYHPEQTVNLVQLLIKHGETLTATDPYNHTLLHALASSSVKNKKNIIKFLVDHEVVDCQDQDGMYATEVAFLSCVDANQIQAARDFTIYLRRALDMKHDREKHQRCIH